MIVQTVVKWLTETLAHKLSSVDPAVLQQLLLQEYQQNSTQK